MPFEKTWRVYVGDTDCFGLMYTPVAIDYIIRTLEDFRREMGFHDEITSEGNVIAPARNVNVNYVGNILPGDDLTIHMRPSVGNTSITYAVTGNVADEQVVEGELTFVYFDRAANNVTPVPETIRKRVEDA